MTAKTEVAPDTTKLNVFQKLALAKKTIGKGIAKRGTADPSMGGYGFVRYDDVAGELGEILAEIGLVIVPSMPDQTTVEVGKTRNGNPIYRSTVNITFKIVNADNPQDFVEASWWGEGDDSGDKSLQKAGTSCSKYFLMKLMQLGGAEDTEASAVKAEQGSTPGVDRPFAEGDPCPECRKLGLKGKFKDRFGKLQCSGNAGTREKPDWKNHIAPDFAPPAPVPDQAPPSPAEGGVPGAAAASVAALVKAYVAIPAAARTRIIAALDYAPATGQTVKQWAAGLTEEQRAEVIQCLQAPVAEGELNGGAAEKGTTSSPGPSAEGAPVPSEAGGLPGEGASETAPPSDQPVVNVTKEIVLAVFQKAGMEKRAQALQRTDFPGGQVQPLEHLSSLSPTGLAIAYAALTS